VVAVSIADKDLVTLSIVPYGGRRAQAISAFVAAELTIDADTHKQSAFGIELLDRMIMLSIRSEYPYCAVTVNNQILLIKGPLGYFTRSRQMIVSSPSAEEMAARVKFNHGRETRRARLLVRLGTSEIIAEVQKPDMPGRVDCHGNGRPYCPSIRDHHR
jgi:hypothetical protein